MISSTCCMLFMIILCCINTQLASSASTDEDGSNKSKREAGGPSGLFPFPRIGRSGPDSWFIDTSGKHIYQGGRSYFNTNNEASKYKTSTTGNPKGLIPFPRVGRALEVHEDFDSNAVQGLMKRQGLVPFPRIGRSGGLQTISSSGPGNNANGLWFGPRLGRLQRRDSFDSPWALVTLRDYPSITSRRQPEAFTPRLGRESSEDIFDDYEHQRVSDEHA